MHCTRHTVTKTMLRKSILIMLGMLVIFCKATNTEKPFCDHYPTVTECLKNLMPHAKRNPVQEQSLLDTEWLRSLEQMDEPTCKLRDIFFMIPNECRAELLQILNLFVSTSDY